MKAGGFEVGEMVWYKKYKSYVGIKYLSQDGKRAIVEYLNESVVVVDTEALAQNYKPGDGKTKEDEPTEVINN